MKDKTKDKAKPRGKPFKKKDPVTGELDPRINLEGAPKRGASVKEIYDYYDEMTADQIAEMLPPGDLQRAYKQMPKGIAMKHLKAIRVIAAIMFDPTPGLLKEANDRTDGKVPDKMVHEGTLEVKGLQDTLTKVYGHGTGNDNSG